jgi:hypothetical protein
VNIFIQTESDPGFYGKGVQDVLFFHLTHPQEIITYLILFVFPSIYYGFFRANRFYEKGVLVNRGLPFYNEFLSYEEIKSYQIVHSKFLLSLFTKKDGEEILFTVKDMGRILAILDQNNIQGNLTQDLSFEHFVNQRRYIVLLLLVGVLTYVVQYYNLAYYFWRTKWW